MADRSDNQKNLDSTPAEAPSSPEGAANPTSSPTSNTVTSTSPSPITPSKPSTAQKSPEVQQNEEGEDATTLSTQLTKAANFLRQKGVYGFLHIVILILSLILVIYISIDTFKNEAFYIQPRFIRLQFWVCVVFLFDFFVEFFLAERKWIYIRNRFFFFLVSIPYNSIISFYGWTFDPQITYSLHYIPLIRGGYAMSIVVSWFTYNRATGLFISYLATLLFTIYFSSLAFYVFEHHVNPLVVNYYDALWWAFMDATTVGSNIEAVTPVGRILSVLLAALGMMMFPIFTVYVTNILTKNKQSGISIDTPSSQLN